jgi:uncharacterized protein YycO
MRAVIRQTVIIALLALWKAAAVLGDSITAQVRDGDIIFHTSRSSQSLAIQRATGSRYSHMGMILFRDGRPFVFEAVQTVSYTPLEKWVARGEKGHYVVKRLVKADTLVTADAIDRLKAQARNFEGKPYDLTFEWSDERIYCSELVWKIYDRALGIRIGRLQKLRSFHLDDPAVRNKLRERYGSSVPLEEPVISPGTMFDAPNLVVVARR